LYKLSHLLNLLNSNLFPPLALFLTVRRCRLCSARRTLLRLPAVPCCPPPPLQLLRCGSRRARTQRRWRRNTQLVGEETFNISISAFYVFNFNILSSHF